jgi:hypothetical protein
VALAILWYVYHRQYDSLLPLEKQSLAIAFGGTFIFPALLGATTPASPLAPTRDLLPLYYPPLMVLSGLYMYAQGLITRGSYFALGLAHLPLAFVLRLLPDWAPLIYAGFVCAYLAWIAADWRPPAPPCHGGEGKAP